MRVEALIRGCAIAVVVLTCVSGLAASAENPRNRKPEGWDIRLAPAGEPGEAFEMWGTVRDAKGEVLPRATMFVYHTDAQGRYSRSLMEPFRHP